MKLVRRTEIGGLAQAQVDATIAALTGESNIEATGRSQDLLGDVGAGPPRSDPDLSSRALLRAIVDSSDDAIVSKTLDGIITSWSPGAERLFGYTADEAIGESILLIIPDDRQYEERLILERLRMGQRIDHFDTVRRRKDGSLVDISVTITPVHDAHGVIVGASKVARDITDHKRSKALTHLLSAIVESSDDAIVSKSLDGIVTSWNRGAERVFGYMAEEMIGQSILKIIPEDRQDEEPKILARLRRGEHVDHFETVRRRKDGTQIDISLTISPVRDADGQIVGASKIARDITIQKRAEAALRESEDRLKRMNEELETRVNERTAELLQAVEQLNGFTYSVAHDLRQSIRTVVVNSQMLTQDFGESLDEDGKDTLNRLIDSGKRMSQLVDDLLRYARISNQEPRREPIDLSELAAEVIQQAREKYGEIEATIEPEMRTIADPGLVRLVLDNLIDNACKYSRADAPTKIWVGRSNGTFYVRDNGIGFEPRYAKKVFEPFERLHTAQQYPGTGIGLANVKRVIDRHGGTLWAESEPEEGATFYFSFCRSQAAKG
ncbi:MAG TPA: PAS domain S-box protein [Fimbriimonadaceae bacterium]|nr:PAS domain S-box protein [Fimbriimonadaceae bacterium]